MANDPRRDSRAQRTQQLQSRQPRELFPTREVMSLEQEPISIAPDAIVMPPDFMGGGFFESVPLEDIVDGEAGGDIPAGSGTIDPLEWNENHPLWLAYKKGQVRLAEVDGQLVIIDKREDVEESINDLMPRQMFAKGDFVEDDRLASLAQLQYRLGKTMVLYAVCDFASAGSPLLQRATQADTTVPPVGGAILVGMADIGFEGAGEHVIFDIPQGSTVKLPFAGQFGKLTARLMPKYYTASDDGPTKTRTYLQSPAGQTLTSELWNSITIQIMGMNAFPNHNPQNVRGWISEGILSNDLQRSPTRKFYGSVKCDGTIADWHTICPIAFTASHVTLVGGAYDSANPALTSLQFLFILQPTSGVAAPTQGPFDVNETVRIPTGCVGISVFNSPNPIGVLAVPVEVLFELNFSLSP